MRARFDINCRENRVLPVSIFLQVKSTAGGRRELVQEPSTVGHFISGLLVFFPSSFLPRMMTT